MTGKKFISVILLLLVFAVFLPVYGSGENLITNYSFEDVSGDNPSGWSTWAWDRGEDITVFKVRKDDVHSGSRCVTIINNKGNDARYKQVVQVEENSKYKISCWIKTKNVGEKKTGANLSVEGRVETSTDIKGTSKGWQKTEIYLTTGSGIKSIPVTLGLGGYGNLNTGEASFDDVVLEKTESIPDNARVIILEKKEKQAQENKDKKKNVKLPVTKKNKWLLITSAVVAAVAAGLYAYVTRRNKNGDPGGEVFEGDYMPDEGEELKNSDRQNSNRGGAGD